MVDVLLVVGAGGQVGGGVAKAIEREGRKVIRVSARTLLTCINSGIDRTISDIERQQGATSARLLTVGLVIAHRDRGTDPLKALDTELKITHDFVWALSRRVLQLNVIVLGSVTGRLLDKQLPESYHYAKDLQKSIARQSCNLKNVVMNVLELYWFEKYGPAEQTSHYKADLMSLEKDIGHRNIPTIQTIADFIIHLMESTCAPRGQTITYDGGYSLLQR